MAVNNFTTILESLAFLAGGVTSITILVVGIKKTIAWIIKKHHDEEAVQSIATATDFHKNQQIAIDTLQRALEEQHNSIKELSELLTTSLTAIENKLGLESNLLINDARFILENTMRASLDRGSATVDEKMLIGDLFNAYTEAGGNHGVAELYSIYRVLPTP